MLFHFDGRRLLAFHAIDYAFAITILLADDAFIAITP
jgi:hypothetical protein